MIRKIVFILTAGVFIISMASGQGQKPPEKKAPAIGPSPVDQLAEEIAKRLGDELHVRTVVGEEFGDSRLEQILRTHHTEPAAVVSDILLAKLGIWLSQQGSQQDAITLIVINVF